MGIKGCTIKNDDKKAFAFGELEKIKQQKGSEKGMVAMSGERDGARTRRRGGSSSHKVISR